MAQLTAQQKRRAKRAEDFKNQKIESAKDFDFNQHNRKNTPDGQTHVSGQEVKFLRQNNKNEKGNSNFRDNLATLDAQQASGAVFGKRAQSQYDRMSARADKLDARKEAKQRAKEAAGSTGKPTNPIDETVTGHSDSVVGNDNIVGDGNVRGNDNIVGDNNVEAGRDANTGTNSGSHTVGDNNSGTVGNGNAVVDNNVDNSQHQEVNQDNDINTNITGDGNKTFVEQDNSVRNYGGDNRSFVYNSSGGEGSLYDNPASAATMAGFYDVDDSPSAQAAFVDLYSDLNRNNGTRFAGEAMKTVDMFSMDARGYTPEAMGNAIGKSTQYSFDRADRQTGHVFGDIWNPDYITEDWKMPTPPKAIDSNAEEIADKAKDDIDDV